MGNFEAFNYAIESIADHFRTFHIDKVAAIEARGFIFGAPIAKELKAGFVPIRKPGKLPFDVVRKEFQLEYGMSILELHKDAFKKVKEFL